MLRFKVCFVFNIKYYKSDSIVHLFVLELEGNFKLF